MHYYKINIKLLLGVLLTLGVFGTMLVTSPAASAAVDQKYVKQCNAYLDKGFCSGLKQKWIDACSNMWGGPNKQVWIACLSDQAKLTKSSVTTTAGDIPDTQDPATDFANSTCKDANHCNLVAHYVNPLINKFLAPMAGLAVVIGIIWGSIEFSTSGGDPQRAAAGRGRIQKALIGLLAFIFLYAFLNWLLPGGLLP